MRRAGRAYPALTQEVGSTVSTDPYGGMTPNDWAENEARSAEREQRADNPDRQEISPRSRRVTAWILGLLAMALVAYTVLGLLAVSIPGTTPEAPPSRLHRGAHRGAIFGVARHRRHPVRIVGKCLTAPDTKKPLASRAASRWLASAEE